MKMWHLVEPPANVNIMGCKWVFKIEQNSENFIDHFKACFVIQRFLQEGIDFEVFSPVVQYNSNFLPLAAICDLEIHQMNVIIAFFNNNPDKEIYMW